jgi:hypothetical protein
MVKEDGGSPATLVAIAVASRRAGDRELEAQARRELERRYGVSLRFARAPKGHDTTTKTDKEGGSR